MQKCHVWFSNFQHNQWSNKKLEIKISSTEIKRHAIITVQRHLYSCNNINLENMKMFWGFQVILRVYNTPTLNPCMNTTNCVHNSINAVTSTGVIMIMSWHDYSITWCAPWKMQQVICISQHHTWNMLWINKSFRTIFPIVIIWISPVFSGVTATRTWRPSSDNTITGPTSFLWTPNQVRWTGSSWADLDWGHSFT